jgi:hypothetical protein
MTSILITDTKGMPKDWVNFETAVCYEARDKVVWRVGDVVTTFRGGKNSQGNQSTVDIHSILGVTGPLLGDEWFKRTSVHVERTILYGRDQFLCAYCGLQFAPHKLTIDHIIPKSFGGKNIWTNCVSACKPCNHAKADRTPEEAGMPLLFVPYVPNAFEKMILKNRNILGDQMEFLMARVPKNSRLHKQ